MRTFRITFTDGRTEEVDGDSVGVEAAYHVVIRKTVLVIGNPREVVVRRLRGADLLEVTEVRFT